MTATASPWDTLLRMKVRRATHTPAIEQRPETKTAAILRLLAAGPCSAAEICLDVDVPGSGAVHALLKHHIQRGQVQYHAGRYELNPDYDAELQEQIAVAARLLRRHGYQVKPPSKH